MSIQRLIVPAEWKAADDGDPGSLEGYLSTFGNVDLQGDVIEQGAFAKTINKVNWKGIPLLADHRASVRDVLGTIVQASEDSHGLRIKAKFAADPDAQAIRQKLLDGHLKAMSIGYEPMDWGFRELDDGMRVRVLKEVKLWEGSVVVFPANTQALVTTVKAAVRSTIDTVIAGAVANGGDEREIKAALADWVSAQPGGADTKTVISSDLPLLNDRTRSYQEAEVMPRVRAWASSDGSGDVGKLDMKKFSRAFLWREPTTSDNDADGDGLPDQVGAYRLKIGDVVDGKLVAVWRGITTIAAVLQGSRGGTTIPDSDVPGVKAQIEGYYAKARDLFDDDSIQVPWKSASTDYSNAGVDVPGLASLPDGTAQTKDHGPDSARLKMLRADALLAGDDPDAVLDSVAYAGMEARLEGIDEWLKLRTREAELSDERLKVRTREAELTDQISKLRD